MIARVVGSSCNKFERNVNCRLPLVSLCKTLINYNVSVKNNNRSKFSFRSQSRCNVVNIFKFENNMKIPL